MRWDGWSTWIWRIITDGRLPDNEWIASDAGAGADVGETARLLGVS
jgi:hypothetical protein